MQAVVLACAAQAVYIAAYVLFKTATGRMSPIGGRHPLHAAGRLVRSPRWLAGVVRLLLGSGELLLQRGQLLLDHLDPFLRLLIHG